MTDGTPSAEEEVDLENLSIDELIDRVHDLEDEIEQLERKRDIEQRRKRDSTPTARPSSTHTDSDGYDVASDQRVAILVDVQNMYYAARNIHNSKLEFSRLLEFLARGRPLARAIAYVIERPGMEQDKFVEVLKRNGYEVRKKILVERSDGSQKGDWDLGLALEAAEIATRVDALCLVSGDGDFLELVEYLVARGVRAEVASFPETTATDLIKAASYYHRLDERVCLPKGQFPAQ